MKLAPILFVFASSVYAFQQEPPPPPMGPPPPGLPIDGSAFVLLICGLFYGVYKWHQLSKIKR